jgi:phage regulator Rha-like protein
MKKTNLIASAPNINRLIHTLRNEKVILDTDLAALYGVPTKRLNEQVKRNAGRFPKDFMFQLEAQELALLRSQIATLETGRGQHRKYRPYAFTEHGALMAANILNSPRAISMSVYLIRAFVKMREDLIANAAILKRLAEIDKSLLTHDLALRDIYQKLRPLLTPPPDPPKPEIGFHIKEDAAPYRTGRKRDLKP